MAVKKRKPVTPSQRFTSVLDFSGLTRKRPEKRLLRAAKSSGGKRGQRHPRAFPSAVSPGRAAADQGARYTDAHRDGRTRKAMQRPLIKETYTLL